MPMASKWPVTETYNDCQRMVVGHCRMAMQRYGGDFDFWFSEANMIFMQAYHDYDDTKGTKFTTYLSYLLDKRLRSVIRSIAIRGERETAIHTDQPSRPPGLIEHIRDELSEDANLLLAVIIDVPRDVKLAAFSEGAGRTTGERFRTGIREYLSLMGWPRKRIKRTFNELKASLG